MTHTARNGVLVAFSIIALVFVSHILSQIRTRLDAQSDGSAYTVILQEVVTAPSGKKHHASLLTQAIRADGSIVQKLGALGRGSRIIALTTGVKIVTSDTARKKSTTTYESPLGHFHRRPSSHCVNDQPESNETYRGEEEIAGYRAARVERSDMTSWYAVEHGCAPVKTVMDWGKQGRSEKILVSLTPGEPDPALFTVASTYEEVPPSGLHSDEPGEDCGPDCQQHLAERAARMDRGYEVMKLR